MSISENLNTFKKGIPEKVSLVAVSKTKPVEIINEAYEAGQRIFGENKVQDLVAKQSLLPDDIEWHFIGHIQTNKVKFLAPFISMLHGVDSLKLLKEINKRASNVNRVINCLLQFHIAEEQSKFGLSLEEAENILNHFKIEPMPHIRIVGVMGMATYTNDDNQVKKEFRSLKQNFDTLKNSYFADDKDFKEVSMGMSGDYKLAIEEGSTMIRIGTAIFGDRNM